MTPYGFGVDLEELSTLTSGWSSARIASYEGITS
jgi:hypothetical protein